jgi:hypothetical protein
VLKVRDTCTLSNEDSEKYETHKITEENVRVTQAFYRWRSDTTRLHSLLQNSCLGIRRTEEEALEIISSQICTEFIAFIRQGVPELGDIPPSEIFLEEGIVSAETADQLFEKFQTNLRLSVELAMQLFAQMRNRRAHYMFEWMEDEIFDPQRMEVNDEQQGPLLDKILLYLPASRTKVLYCVSPALVKFGDDFGCGYHRRHVLKKANVILSWLPIVNQEAKGSDSSDNEMDTSLEWES